MKFLINRRITISMIFLAVTMLGIISYRQLSLELLPNAEFPEVVVAINSKTEVDPTYLESQAVVMVEGAIKGVEGIEEINTTVDAGNATIKVSFKKSVNFKYASIKLQEKIRSISKDLPDGITANLQKSRSSNVQNSFMTLQVRGEGDVNSVRALADEKIVDKLENIDGVASVGIFGGREKSIEILLNKNAAAAHNVTTNTISQLINQNAQTRTFIGEVNAFNKKYFVHTESNYSSPIDIENIVVSKGPVYLKDIAEVFYDFKEVTSYNRVNGKEAISITLNNESQANIIDVAKRTRSVIGNLNEELAPYGMEIVIASDNAEVMSDNLEQIAWQALIGGLLAVIVLWLFLKNIRLVAIIALSIPISVITAFNLFYAAGISINSLTLVGMALAIGMLLDNSVVVLENIYRLKAGGESSENAVIKGTSEVWRSIFAATLTTITVFLPFIFSDNFFIKLIGYQIGVSIISTLAISLLVAFFFIPMASYLIIRLKKNEVGFYKKISIRNRPIQIYMVLLKMTMRNSFVVFILAVVALFASIILAVSNKEAAQKSAKSDRFMVNFTMHQGTTLEKADEVIKVIEDRLKEIPEMKELISYVTEENATITVVLKDDYEKIGRRDIGQIKNSARTLSWVNGMPCWHYVSDAISGGGGQNDVTNGLNRMLSMMGIGNDRQKIIIKGKDQTTMRLVADDLQYQLSQQDFINYANVSGTGRRPEAHLTLNQLLLNSYEINRNNISQSLSGFNRGTSSDAFLKIDDKDYAIVIKEELDHQDSLMLKKLTQKDLDDLDNLVIRNNNGGLHKLSEISKTRLTWGQSQINRIDGEKQLTVFFQFNVGNEAPKDIIEAYRMDVEELLSTYILPAGVAVEYEEEEDAFADFKFLMIAAGMLIFMILASVFESLALPFVLLFTIPLAAIGSMFALYFTDNSLTNINTLVGLLILLGVVVNNGIILIDYANILRKRGNNRNRAIFSAGLSRVRPILITSITTIIALLPMAFGDSEYSGLIGAPFAICVIGGLACSSLLTLIVIPSVYLGLENTISWYKQLSKKIIATHILLIAFLLWFINNNVDGVLYQIIYFVIVLVAVPGITYLILTSLRSANKDIIPANEPIKIHIENLVKIYDRPSLFEREWEGGVKLRKRLVPNSIWNNKYVRMLPYIIIPLLLILKNDQHSGWIPYYFISALIYFIRRTSAYVYDNNIEIRNIEGKHSKIKRAVLGFAISVPLIGKRHRPYKALKGVSFEITNGMFGLLGPNGAGKSTFIRIISGILEQSYGTILINNLDTKKHREALQGLIGYLPQEFGTYESMSAYDFLDYQAILKSIVDPKIRKERLEYVLKSVHMWERKDDKIQSFSGGMKQRIGIALILLHLPRILVVDEPTAGLDPRERIRFRNLLVELSKERIVIFSTHIIEDISSSCNQVVVINKGDLKYFGTPDEMLGFAESCVWSFTVTQQEFEEELDMQYVVLHIQEGENIQVRYISETSPREGAERVEETLEDAYLCLLKGINKPGCEEALNIISELSKNNVRINN